ncbi:DEKNAAC104851 [Brettanomyces naardenensis]|uniref:DEKNAAC104851 n=1 Tax=Brettanomyces naardenensis TaxID=13370 RepID=A0A448YRX5_BRENA|nr:DEKNAAC104851 [Brettanomyces naardenensis]
MPKYHRLDNPASVDRQSEDLGVLQQSPEPEKSYANAKSWDIGSVSGSFSDDVAQDSGVKLRSVSPSNDEDVFMDDRRVDEAISSSAFEQFDLDEDDIGFPLTEATPQSVGGNFRAAFFNMTNSIVGAGIVGIPRALKNSGLLSGVILLTALAALNDWTLRLIILNTKLSGARTYTGFVTKNFGKPGKVIVLLSQGLFAFGGSVGFAVIIGDSIPHVLRSLFKNAAQNSKFVNFLLSRNVIIVFCIGFISYPLSLTRDISKLAKASGLALISMLIIIIIVVVTGPQMPASIRGPITGSEWFIQSGIFKGISVISFAMVCHHNTTFIYDSLRKPTLDRFNAVTHLSCTVSSILCAIMGLSGFLNFGSKTKGNVLNNFPGDDWAVNIARFCFGLNMLTTFPLEIYVVREVFKDLLTIYQQIRRRDPTYKIEQLSDRQHVIVTTFVSFLPMVISLFTCNLGAVLELVGATSASVIAYILPPMCYDKMTKRGKTTLQRIPSILCIVFGFVVMVVSSTQTIMDSINEKEGGHCVD